MTLPGPMTLLPISGAAALLVAMLIVVSIRRVRANKRVALAQAKETALIDQIEARIDGLAQRLEGHQTLMMNRLHDDNRGLQSDMDWLAGERMIEEEMPETDPQSTLKYILTEISKGKVVTLGECRFSSTSG